MAAILLSTAFVTTLNNSLEGKKRIIQYHDGIEKILDRYNNQRSIEIYLSDNTIKDPESLDERLRRVISRLNQNNIIIFDNNNYGKLNKGCGLVVQWKKALPRITLAGHEHLVHFEPRQRLINFNFIDHCLKTEENAFREDTVITKKWRIFKYKYRHFQTGLLAANVMALSRFVNTVNIEDMVKKRISIESMIRRYFRKNSLNYKTVERLGVLWDSYGREIEL